jgi:FkbM family methyltransferase
MAIKKYLMTTAIRSNLSRIKNFLIKKEIDPLDQLKRKPRYTKGSFIVAGHGISFPDCASFAAMYEEIFFRNVYTFESTTKNPFIIDCGANIGVSILFFKNMYPDAEILAFEPDGEIFKYLQSNIASSQLDNINLVNKGVWKEDAELSFESEGADAGRIHSENGKEVPKLNKIIVERLSPYLNKEVDFLKIDIEGAELEVIREIAPRLSMVKNIFVEYHSFVNRPQQLDELLSILSGNGFRYYIYTAASLKDRPFVDKPDFLDMDCLLNICAFRN